MDITLSEDGALCRASLRGELDIYAAAELRQVLLGLLQRHAAIELNLAGVEAIDTAGVQVLMATKAAAMRAGGAFSMRAHSRPVLDALERCQLLSYFGDPVIELGEHREMR